MFHIKIYKKEFVVERVTLYLFFLKVSSLFLNLRDAEQEKER